ncbi:MAG: hypothetical protein FWE14_03490 [Lachnospiraceae bacterium]|nr:hypothetical protein [Lachnospiraceae bacterium]
MSLNYLNDLFAEVEAKEAHDIDGGCTVYYWPSGLKEVIVCKNACYFRPPLAAKMFNLYNQKYVFLNKTD